MPEGVAPTSSKLWEAPAKAIREKEEAAEEILKISSFARPAP
jgi:hypothetical protein